jgi:hypothetical protein
MKQIRRFMGKFDPSKLTVEFREGVTETGPLIPRRYTLTHSDITAELFLTIGQNYAYDKISPMRDEVLGEWMLYKVDYYYPVYLHVDGNNPTETLIRNLIFRRELPLALEAIRYGDHILFEKYERLDYVPIIVYFLSEDPQFNKTENWGTFCDYDVTL